MKLPGVPYTPRYTTGEMAVGIALAFVLHAGPVGVLLYKKAYPSAPTEEEKPLVSRPVVQAALLKLGKPIDPKKLPDRLVPQQRTAPKKQINASQDDPGQKKPDAGAPPPPVAEDSDLTNLVNKSDPFAEKPGKTRPEEGHEGGVDGGTETDPNKVRAGDMYALSLGQFIAQRFNVPTVISIGEERRLCATFEMNISKTMGVWHVRPEPVRSSGNELFDDAARSTLLKLVDDRTVLPTPPKEVDELYRGRRINLQVVGKNGDPSKCR